jgi:flagellar assembly protein FliH
VSENPTVRLPRPVATVRVVGSDGSPVPSAHDAAGSQDSDGQVQQNIQAERDRLVQASKALTSGLAELTRLREEMIRQSEQQLLELALEIARKVLMQEIQAGRYEIDPIVKEALLHVPARQDVIVHLHPDDWATCQMAREEVSTPRPAGLGASEGSSVGAGGIQFVADPGVRRGECLLETAEGIVESAVENHLADIGEALKNTE